jgi:hypothetical protein
VFVVLSAVRGVDVVVLLRMEILGLGRLIVTKLLLRCGRCIGGLIARWWSPSDL